MYNEFRMLYLIVEYDQLSVACPKTLLNKIEISFDKMIKLDFKTASRHFSVYTYTYRTAT